MIAKVWSMHNYEVYASKVQCVHMYLATYLLQTLKFLEYINDLIPKLNKIDEDREQVDIVKSNIEKWLELLIGHISMLAPGAIKYVKLLRSHKGLKKYEKFISGKVSE